MLVAAGTTRAGALSGRHAKHVVLGALNLRTGTRLFLVRTNGRAADFQAFLALVRSSYRGWHVALLLGDDSGLHAGDEVRRTGRVMDVAVGNGLLGHIIDPLGRPLDGLGPVPSIERLPTERPAAPIMVCAAVTVPLQTGLKVIDALIPVGRGQRELIMGDRQTGKTAIAIDTILNQRGKNVLCVYCAIGQRASAVAKAIAILREKGALEYTVVVAAEGNEAPGLSYIAPYAATSIAEHFMEAGRDVLIVYDDLTQHAQAYREISPLLATGRLPRRGGRPQARLRAVRGTRNLRSVRRAFG